MISAFRRRVPTSRSCVSTTTAVYAVRYRGEVNSSLRLFVTCIISFLLLLCRCYTYTAARTGCPAQSWASSLPPLLAPTEEHQPTAQPRSTRNRSASAKLQDATQMCGLDSACQGQRCCWLPPGVVVVCLLDASPLRETGHQPCRSR